MQHDTNWSGKQRVGLPADPNDAGALTVNEIGVYKLTLVVENLEADLDTVRNEGPTCGTVFPMHNVRNNHIVKLFKILVENLIDCYGNRNNRNGAGVTLQFLGKSLDDICTRSLVDGAAVCSVDRGDQKDSRLRIQRFGRRVQKRVMVRCRASGCNHGQCDGENEKNKFVHNKSFGGL